MGLLVLQGMFALAQQRPERLITLGTQELEDFLVYEGTQYLLAWDQKAGKATLWCYNPQKEKEHSIVSLNTGLSYPRLGLMTGKKGVYLALNDVDSQFQLLRVNDTAVVDSFKAPYFGMGQRLSHKLVMDFEMSTGRQGQGIYSAHLFDEELERFVVIDSTHGAVIAQNVLLMDSSLFYSRNEKTYWRNLKTQSEVYYINSWMNGISAVPHRGDHYLSFKVNGINDIWRVGELSRTKQITEYNDCSYSFRLFSTSLGLVIDKRAGYLIDHDCHGTLSGTWLLPSVADSNQRIEIASDKHASFLSFTAVDSQHLAYYSRGRTWLFDIRKKKALDLSGQYTMTYWHSLASVGDNYLYFTKDLIDHKRDTLQEIWRYDTRAQSYTLMTHPTHRLENLKIKGDYLYYLAHEKVGTSIHYHWYRIKRDEKVYVSTQNEDHYNSDLSLFPNPTQSSTTLSYSLLNGASVGIELYSSTGQLLQSIYSGYNEPGSYSLEIELPNAGLYFIKLTLDGKSTIRQVAMRS